MSIVICYGCDKRIDIDYEEFNGIYDEEFTYALCSNCYEEREEAND